MTRELLVAGGGIAGLAAAVAASRAGWGVRLFEQADAFGEVGAGVQLGPNATSVLRTWGLLDTVARHACEPQRLLARDAHSGRTLGTLPVAARMASRYGAPYLTLHRADLHRVLLRAAQDAGARLHTGSRLLSAAESGDVVRVRSAGGTEVEGDALAVADGLWSVLRRQLLGSPEPVATGHVAWRALVPAQALPPAHRSLDVTAWLGPHLHVVSYPVRGGELVNLVCVVAGRADGDPAAWDHALPAAALHQALGVVCNPLQALVEAAPSWGLWMLHDRAPVASAGEMARGRIALLGDAAHPMRPYLAQGAAMALEDAHALGRTLAMADDAGLEVPLALARYALQRWERCARVQRRSVRNGRVFHATGAVRVARDASLRWLGPQLMDQPWLYRPAVLPDPG